MLKKAAAYNEKKKETKGTPKFAILLVDSDRSTHGDDGWTIANLRQEASKKNIIVCLQEPNQEGLFFRMIQGNENKQVNSNNALKLLRNSWPEYQKPVDARTIAMKYTMDDLMRSAKVDVELNKLLEIIGLIRKQNGRG